MREPNDQAWQAYIKPEERERASAIYDRWVAVRPGVKGVEMGSIRGGQAEARPRQSTTSLPARTGNDTEHIEKAKAAFNAFAWNEDLP